MPGSATTYYVAPEGSDSNPGTSLDAPFQSVGHAAQLMVAADTCWLRAGIYRETLAPVNSGTPTAPITFAAYSNEVATLTGAEVIGGWTALGDGSFAAAAGWSLGAGYDQVFVDGIMLAQARFPNFGAGDLLHPAVATVKVDPAHPNVVTSAAWDGHPDDYWAGAWFDGGVGLRWSWQCARVLSSSGNSLTLDPSTESRPWFTGTGVGFVWGLASLLNTGNEWHLEGQSGSYRLLLRLSGGVDPSGHEVELKRRFWCINLHGQNYIHIRGLRLQAGAVNLSGNGNVLENCRGRYLSHYLTFHWGYSFCGDNAAGSGILIQGTNNVVRGCTFSDTAGSGIISRGAHNSIVRNLLFNTDYSGTYACALRLEGVQDLVTFNTAHNSGRDILQPGGAGHSIYLNDLSVPGVLCRDLGVVYIWGVNARTPGGISTRIAYNWIHNHTASDGPSPLIYLDNWSRNFIVDHNVCWNNSGDAGIRINGPAAGHQLYNNTLFHCDPLGTHTYNMWPDLNPDPAFWTANRYRYTARNSLYLGNAPESQLVDWVHCDFRLKPQAAARGAGVPVAGYTVPNVAQPDRGAYESEGAVWKPGLNGRW
jgi:Pel9A-like, right handed beta helix region